MKIRVEDRENFEEKTLYNKKLRKNEKPRKKRAERDRINNKALAKYTALTSYKKKVR